MKSFSEFLKEVDDPQQSALSAHQARTAGMRQAKSGTVGVVSKTPFRKRPSIGLSKLLLGKERKKPPTQPAVKKKSNPIVKGLGATPAS